jgi:hypothetical protein
MSWTFGVQTRIAAVATVVGIRCMLGKEETILNEQEHLVRKMAHDRTVDELMRISTPSGGGHIGYHNQTDNAQHSDE